jgi:hypothetical protein
VSPDTSGYYVLNGRLADTKFMRKLSAVSAIDAVAALYVPASDRDDVLSVQFRGWITLALEVVLRMKTLAFDHIQILWAIVVSNAIAMMNDFLRLKVSAEHCFNYEVGTPYIASKGSRVLRSLDEHVAPYRLCLAAAPEMVRGAALALAVGVVANVGVPSTPEYVPSRLLSATACAKWGLGVCRVHMESIYFTAVTL